MWDLVLPHFFLGLGIGIVDSSLMPLLAKLVDQECNAEKCSPYGSVYAIAQTAVSLAYGFGPLFGGKLSETYGFPQVMRTVGIINFVYMPLMYFLRNEHEEIFRENNEISRAESVRKYRLYEIIRLKNAVIMLIVYNLPIYYKCSKKFPFTNRFINRKH